MLRNTLPSPKGSLANDPFLFSYPRRRIIIKDEEGADFASYEAAEEEAYASVRDLAQDYLRAGKRLSTQAIEIMDEAGESRQFVSVNHLFH